MSKITQCEKEKTFVSAVVYVHNNECEITGFLKTLTTWMDHKFLEYEIICVNDASTDETPALIEKYGRGGKKNHCYQYGILPGSRIEYECRNGFGNWRFCIRI